MRDPIGPLVPRTQVTITTGNQFQGPGNAGNQLQDGSSLLFRVAGDADWTEVGLTFESAADNNKYFSAEIGTDALTVGDSIQYYLRIAYDDHDTTFLQAAGDFSAVTDDENAARTTPFTFTLDSSATLGRWGPLLTLPAVPIHAHLLPSGRVLMWGRRDRPDQTLDEQECTPIVWDPADGQGSATPQPVLADGQTTVNLFCSGHTFLPDGRLLVAGGHFRDSQGLDQATIYDPAANTWTATATMNHGRWYPTATGLPDGSVLVLSGSYQPEGPAPPVNNTAPQVWHDNGWAPIVSFPDGAPFDLYPRTHVGTNGKVVMSGPLVQTWSLDTANGGQWTPVATQPNPRRDYAPSVLYDQDLVVYLGGGNEEPGGRPTSAVEILDVSEDPMQWRASSPMSFGRRQHNATILPDGSVLVTGGTRGVGFNDLGAGQPVHPAELWDPKTGQWRVLAAELKDRCYHSTAVLLPDGTVLSGGGGEYKPNEGSEQPNDPQDTHRDAQIFEPPYLFTGPRPDLTAAPAAVTYGEVFQVATSRAADIAKVSWVRLSSVTHSFNLNQRINFLTFQSSDPNVAGPPQLSVTAPASAEVCPPGHYLMFLIDGLGVPSLGSMIHVQAVVPALLLRSASSRLLRLIEPVVNSVRAALTDDAPPDRSGPAPLSAADLSRGTVAVVGVTGLCPYGIAACWGGANEALRSLAGVARVAPVPDLQNSTATLVLSDHGLPPLASWRDQFARMVAGSYHLRGVEITLTGPIEERDGDFFVGPDATTSRPPVALSRLHSADKVQWDRTTRASRPADPHEAQAFDTLVGDSVSVAARRRVSVTGPLQETAAGYVLSVRVAGWASDG